MALCCGRVRRSGWGGGSGVSTNEGHTGLAKREENKRTWLQKKTGLELGKPRHLAVVGKRKIGLDGMPAEPNLEPSGTRFFYSVRGVLPQPEGADVQTHLSFLVELYDNPSLQFRSEGCGISTIVQGLKSNCTAFGSSSSRCLQQRAG